MRELEEHESALHRRLEDGLAGMPGVTLHGRAERRTPTTLFSVAGQAPVAVAAALAEHGVNAPAGSFYAVEAARWLGLGDAGAIRAGIAPYTDESDVDRLLAAVGAIVG
jgi:selenocysteine lyase/cysteine desulfurase